MTIYMDTICIHIVQVHNRSPTEIKLLQDNYLYIIFKIICTQHAHFTAKYDAQSRLDRLSALWKTKKKIHLNIVSAIEIYLFCAIITISLQKRWAIYSMHLFDRHNNHIYTFIQVFHILIKRPNKQCAFQPRRIARNSCNSNHKLHKK